MVGTKLDVAAFLAPKDPTAQPPLPPAPPSVTGSADPVHG